MASGSGERTPCQAFKLSIKLVHLRAKLLEVLFALLSHPVAKKYRSGRTITMTCQVDVYIDV